MNKKILLLGTVLSIILVLSTGLVLAAHDADVLNLNPTETWETLENTFSFEVKNTGVNDSIINFTITLSNFTVNDAYHIVSGKWTADIQGNSVTWVAIPPVSISSTQLDSGFRIVATATEVGADINSTWDVETWDDTNESNSTIAGPVLIKNDANSPTVTPITPQDMSFVMNGIMLINISAIDNETGIKNATMLWDDDTGVANVTTPDETEALTCDDGYCTGAFNTTVMGFNDSRFYLNHYYLVYDNVENTNTKINYHVYVDIEAPTVNLESPSNSTFIQADTYNFSFNTIDNSFDAESEGFTTDIVCQLYIDWALQQSALPPMENATSTNITANLTDLEDGDHFWYVSCIDDAGWEETSETRVFTRDKNPPTIELISPTDNNYISSSDIEFQWKATDAVDEELNCNLTLDGAVNKSNVTSLNNSITSSNITGLSEGSHSWNLTCWDDVPNSNTSETWTFTVDVTPPTVDTVGKNPLNNSYDNDGNILFYFNLDDNIDTVLDCELYLNNGLSWSDSKNVGSDLNISKINLNNSDYDWYIKCVDDANNNGSSSVKRVTVDTTNPDVFLNYPDNGSYINSGDLLNYSISDENLDSVWYIHDGGSNTPLLLNYDIDTTGWAEGPHTVDVCANDSATNTKCINTSFTIDDTLPSFIYFIPLTTADGSHEQDYIEANVTAFDINFDIIEIYLQPTCAGCVGQVTWSNSSPFFANFTDLEPGEYELFAEALDKAKNKNITEIRTIMLLAETIEELTPPSGGGGGGRETGECERNERKCVEDSYVICEEIAPEVYQWSDEIFCPKGCEDGVCLPCEESWECTEWSECTDGTRQRTCTDLNHCASPTEKPAEEEECTGATGLAILGAFLGGVRDNLGISVPIIAIIIVAIVSLIYAKKKGLLFGKK